MALNCSITTEADDGYGLISDCSVHKSGLKTLTVADGLVGEVVNRIMTDHSGQLWIASSGGTNMYDGKHLATFPMSDRMNDILNVLDLCETENGCMYAATDHGVYKLRKAISTSPWEQIMPSICEPRCLLADGNLLYIGSEQGLHVFDGEQQRTVWTRPKGKDEPVLHCVLDEKGTVWFLTPKALYTYRSQKMTVQPQLLFSDLGEDFHGVPSQLAKVGDKCFIGTRFSGLYVYNLITKQAKRVEGVGNVVMTVSQSRDNYICVATDGAGAYLIDPESCEVVEHYTMDRTGLPTNAVYSFYRDALGGNWFGLMRYGLCHMLTADGLFRAYHNGDFSTSGLNVRSFLIQDGECLIGTQEGCWYADKESHVMLFLSPTQLGGHIVNNIVWWNDNYYISTYDGGVRVFNPQTHTLRPVPDVPQLAHTTIGDMRIGPDSCLWIGCTDGLFIIEGKGKGGKTMVRHLTAENSGLVSGTIVSIAFDPQDRAWLSGASGLSVFNPTNDKLETPDLPDSLFSKHSYLHITPGDAGKFYLHNGPRLLYISIDMSNYGHVPLHEVLAHHYVRGFAADRQGAYWMATETGLFRISHDGEDIIYFGATEGLVGEINTLQKDYDGTLWVATSQGLYTIEPDQLSKWMQTACYPIQLFNMRRGPDLITDAEALIINDKKQIRLTWNLHSEIFQAEAVTLDYSGEKGNLYEYRIDGRPWTMITDNHPLVVRNLMPGHHLLEVRRSGLDAGTVSYDITVVPSLAAIFELVLLILIFASIFIFYRSRKNTKVLLDERSRMEEALMESETIMAMTEEQFREENTREIAVGLIPDAEQSQTKYQNVKLDEQECEDVVQRMRELLVGERLFTNPDLKRTDLAERLHISPTRLSQIFTLHLKENYYEFINRYRLTEFKRLIAAGEYRRFTITALSEQCGFKKTSFFTTFRKVEGMTPAEYLKKQNISAKF